MQIISPNEFSPFRSEIKRCPKCASVFVDENNCESCGYQLNFDALGAPLGEKSYYGLADQYWRDVSPMGVRLSVLEAKSSGITKKYKRSLVHRYQLLLQYFLSTSADYAKTQQNQIYLVELNDLIKEMVRLEVPSVVFWQGLGQSEDGLSSYFYQKVMISYDRAKAELDSEKKQHWSTRKYFGFIDLAMMARIGMFVLILTSLGYAFMNYLAIR